MRFWNTLFHLLMPYLMISGAAAINDGNGSYYSITHKTIRITSYKKKLKLKEMADPIICCPTKNSC